MKEITKAEDLDYMSFYFCYTEDRNPLISHGRAIADAVGEWRIFGPIQLPTLEDVLKECGE